MLVRTFYTRTSAYWITNMAGEFTSKADKMSPKRSYLEADDGCLFYPGSTSALSSAKNHLFGGVGMDVCDSPQVCDSGVSMTSFGCEGIPSLCVMDPIKPPLTKLEDPATCVSIGYTSFTGHEDIEALEGHMEILSVSETVTTTASIQSTPCPATAAAVDPRRQFVERLKVYFTPDTDGDT